MKESIFNIKVKVNDNNYIYNSKNNGIIQLNDKDLLSKEDITYLLNEGYYVEDKHNEIEELVKEVNEAITKDSEELLLTISMTQKCNFSCVYCYQDRKEENLDFDNANEILEVVREVFDNEKQIKRLKIHFFGGEPLLNFEVLSFLDKGFKDISNNYNVEYKSYLTTNGSMLNEDILSDIGFEGIQLSFDGLEDNHNKIRKSFKFKFEDTVKLIGTILKYCEKIDIRFNVCEENKKDLLPFIDFIMSKVDSKKINFHIAQTIKFHETDKFNMLSFEEYCTLNLKARIKLYKYGKKSLLPIRLTYGCPFINGHAISISPTLQLNLCDGNTEILQRKFCYSSIKHRKEYKVEEECLKCEVLPLCLGGCIANKKFRSRCITEKNIIKQLIAEYIKNNMIDIAE